VKFQEVSDMNEEEKEYMFLMAKYKQARRVGMGPEANEFLKAAMKIKKSGNVRREIVLGSDYL